MAVADRWHTKKPRVVDGKPVAACKEHRQYPSTDHLKGDRWQVRWRDEHGKQCKQNFAKKTGKDPETCADAFDAKIKAELDAGTYVNPADANTTFKTYAEDWRKNRQQDANTANRVELQLRKHVYPVIGDRPLRELAKRPTIIQAWISGMKGAARSKIQIIKDTSAVFNAAVDDGLIPRNPIKAKSIQRPTVPPKDVQPWPLAWVEGMAAELDPRWSVIPYLGAGTGMRQGEIFGISVDDIDFLRRKITIRRQVRRINSNDKLVFAPIKNDNIHEVPLTDFLAVILSEHIKNYRPVEVTLPWDTVDGKPVTHKLLVTRADGRAINATIFTRNRWNPARRKLNIPAARKNGMHALRHTFASAALSEGVDIVTVAAYLGDAVATVLDTYAHLMPNREDYFRAALGRFFSPASAQNVPSVAQ